MCHPPVPLSQPLPQVTALCPLLSLSPLTPSHSCYTPSLTEGNGNRIRSEHILAYLCELLLPSPPLPLSHSPASTQFSPNKITMAAAHPPLERVTLCPCLLLPPPEAHLTCCFYFSLFSCPFFFDVNLISAFTF